MNQPQPAWLREIWSLLEAGEKIEAIRRYREETGTDLADAVEAINRIQQAQRGAAVSPRTPLPNEAPEQVRGGLEWETLKRVETAGKIGAIKYVREQTGLGLKEAKDYVEALITQHHPQVAPLQLGYGIYVGLVGFILLGAAVVFLLMK